MGSVCSVVVLGQALGSVPRPSSLVNEAVGSVMRPSALRWAVSHFGGQGHEAVQPGQLISSRCDGVGLGGAGGGHGDQARSVRELSAMGR